MKIKHEVCIKYGLTEIKLTADDLQLIADALEIINPDTTRQENKARRLAASFSALSEYAASVKA